MVLPASEKIKVTDILAHSEMVVLTVAKSCRSSSQSGAGNLPARPLPGAVAAPERQHHGQQHSASPVCSFQIRPIILKTRFRRYKDRAPPSQAIGKENCNLKFVDSEGIAFGGGGEGKGPEAGFPAPGRAACYHLASKMPVTLERKPLDLSSAAASF